MCACGWIGMQFAESNKLGVFQFVYLSHSSNLKQRSSNKYQEPAIQSIESNIQPSQASERENEREKSNYGKGDLKNQSSSLTHLINQSISQPASEMRSKWKINIFRMCGERVRVKPRNKLARFWSFFQIPQLNQVVQASTFSQKQTNNQTQTQTHTHNSSFPSPVIHHLVVFSTYFHSHSRLSTPLNGFFLFM